eukprot:6194621-Pleurochrysis_carterae.AAC.4
MPTRTRAREPPRTRVRERSPHTRARALSPARRRASATCSSVDCKYAQRSSDQGDLRSHLRLACRRGLRWAGVAVLRQGYRKRSSSVVQKYRDCR